MCRLYRLLFPVLFCAASLALAQAEPIPEFSDDEIERIVSHGPWPPKVRADPGNRVSGKIHAIELGRRLFRDARMSPVGYIGCVTCHQPDRAFTDHRARAHGLADLPRNTPTLANLRQQRWYGWGGSSDSLWMASIRPMLDAREFGSNPEIVARIFERDPELAACYRKVFRDLPARDHQRTLVNVGKALAAFQETLITGRTPFDDFRDTLARKRTGAGGSYPLAAQRGLKLFVGPAGCAACHTGPSFSDGDFHPGATSATPTPAGKDAGRLDGAREVTTSALNLLGSYNDDRSRANAAATRRLVVDESMRGKFRTPGLRNVAVTAPYMHDGRFDSLHQVLEEHKLRHALDPAAPPDQPMSMQQIGDVAAFLDTLTDSYGERRPWSTQALTSCP